MEAEYNDKEIMKKSRKTNKKQKQNKTQEAKKIQSDLNESNENFHFSSPLLHLTTHV